MSSHIFKLFYFLIIFIFLFYFRILKAKRNSSIAKREKTTLKSSGPKFCNDAEPLFGFYIRIPQCSWPTFFSCYSPSSDERCRVVVSSETVFRPNPIRFCTLSLSAGTLWVVQHISGSVWPAMPQGLRLLGWLNQKAACSAWNLEQLTWTARSLFGEHYSSNAWAPTACAAVNGVLPGQMPDLETACWHRVHKNQGRGLGMRGTQLYKQVKQLTNTLKSSGAQINLCKGLSI